MNAPLHKLSASPSPQRSRSRRERRSEAARKPVLHVVMPGCEVARAEIKPRETISAFLRRVGWATKDRTYGWQFKKGLPTVLEVNGEPVLRRFWTTTRIAANDNVRFVSYPLGGQGGGAKQVIGLVALVAVAAFAMAVTGGAAAAFLGSSFAAGSLGAYGLGAAISIGGSLLVNALTAPKAGATNAPDATQDQIYSVGAQGNTAKLGQPLPVQYGRLKRFPDFAASPWGEFVGNDQYVNVLLAQGMGSFEYESLYIDDTPLWTAGGGVSAGFSSAQVAFYEAGDAIDLFPVNVETSDEVSGQQLPIGNGFEPGQYWGGLGTLEPGAWLGPFVANSAGTQAQSLAIDFVFPGGCFNANTDNNEIGYARVTLTAEYCPCDDAGAPTGAFATMFSGTKQYNSTSPIRDSIKIDVFPGRYLVRFRRESNEMPNSHGTNAVAWAGLRSFLKGQNSFPDVATVAVRLKASQSTQGSYKFGTLATRKVPVWNGSIFVAQATRSNGWAFLDAVSNAQYGSGLSLSKVDFNAIVNFAAGCDARGDKFDYCFTSATSMPDALDKILTPARARHFWLGDTISVVRDEWRDVPSMMLTDREIVRDSTQITLTMLGDEDPDAVIVEYIDESTWLPAQVQYPPDGEFFTAVNAEVKRIDGIVGRDQAYRECAFYYLQSIYRRENVQIGTEYEGRAITFGSVIRIQSELPQAYGFGGAVVGVSGTSLTLNPAPTWDGGPYYVRLRRPNGSWFGPVAATMGENSSIAILNAGDLASVQTSQGIALADVLAREDGGEYPSFEFNTADSQSKLCVVLSGAPNGDTCTLNLVVDDIRVHATDLGNPPVLPSSQFPTNDNVPLLIGLNATFGQGTAEPKLEASWFPSPGALYYIADISYDGGVSWAQVYEGQGNQLSAVVTLAALTLRVQAVSAKVRGPYAEVSLDAPTIVVASETVAISSIVAGIRDQVTTEFTKTQERISDIEDVVDLLGNEIARNRLDKTGLRGQVIDIKGALTQQTFDIRDTLVNTIQVNKDAADASITEVRDVAVGTRAAFSDYTITTNATLGSIQGQVTSTSQALATLDASYAGFTNSVASQFDATSTAITNEATVRSSADTALGNLIETLTGTVSGNTAAITSEANIRAEADLAQASQITSLTGNVAANTAAISNETGLRVTADTSLANQIASLTTSVNGNTAAITSEATVRSSADSVLGGQISTISGNVSANAAAITNEASLRVAADNVLAGQISTISGNVGANSAAISTETALRVSGDSSLAGQINTVSSAVAGQSVSISTVQSSLNGVQAQYSVLLTADDGSPSGFTLSGMRRIDGSFFTGFYFRADQVVIDGTVIASKIATAAVTTIKLQAQAVTADKIQTGAITSDTGVIGALGVKSLSIGDYAVTVPRTQTYGDQLAPGRTHSNICAFDISFDTTGLGGKEMCVFASLTATLLYADTTGLNANAELIIQTTIVSQNQTVDRSGVIAMSGAYTFVATGGPMSFNVRANAGLGSNVVMTFRTLYAVISKR